MIRICCSSPSFTAGEELSHSFRLVKRTSFDMGGGGKRGEQREREGGRTKKVRPTQNLQFMLQKLYNFFLIF